MISLTAIANYKFFKSKYFYPVVVFLAVAGGALVLFWPMLIGQTLFPIKVIGMYHYVYFQVMQNFINHLGILPNWWPAYDSGYPISLGLDAFLNPIFLLVLKFVPAFFANTSLIYVFFIINAVCFNVLARALGISKTGSLIATLAYAFSGIMIGWFGVTTFASVLFFLPLSFLCCLRIMNGQKKWFWLWLILLTYAWIGGFAEIVVYSLVALLAFIVYLIIQNRDKFNYRNLALFFGAITLSVVILSPWFLSVTHFIADTQRANGVPVPSGTDGMATTLSHFVHMLYPRLSIYYGENLPLVPLGSLDFYLFIGFLPLLLVFISLFTKNKKDKKYLHFFIGLATAAILTTVNHSPIFYLLHKVPVLNWFGGYWKWSFIVVLSLALLAGWGFDNLKNFLKQRAGKYTVIALWLAITMAIGATSFISLKQDDLAANITAYGQNHYKNSADRFFGRSEEYYSTLISNITDSVLFNFSLASPLLILTLALWLVAIIYITVIYKTKGGLDRGGKLAAIVIVWASSLLVWQGFYDGPPVTYLTELPQTANFLRQDNNYNNSLLPLDSAAAAKVTPYRIYFHTPDQYVAALSDQYVVKLAGHSDIKDQFFREMMDDNIFIAYNFDSFYNHQTLAAQRLINLNYLALRQARVKNDTKNFTGYIQDFFTEENFRLLGALNIQYVLSPFAPADKKIKPAFTSSLSGANQIPIHVYKNPYFMPRWFLAKNILWGHPDNTLALSDLQTIKDFQTQTLIEPITANDQALKTGFSPDDKLDIELYTAGQLRIKTKVQNYRFLVFSEYKAPFWKATINGQAVPIYRANYLYQAILVPPGENTVEFIYPGLWEQSLIAAKAKINQLLDTN